MAVRRAGANNRPRRTGLADALFTATQKRVLGLLFGQPARSFFATEIIGLTAGGSGAVQRELARLSGSGLVTVTLIGGQKHYQANRESPVFPELSGMIMKTVGIADPLREALAPLAGRIRLAFIYGSIAKGSDTAKSDIDLMIVADDLTLEKVFRVLAPVEKRLARSINPTLYGSAEYQGLRAGDNAFLAKVLAGETISLIANADGPFNRGSVAVGRAAAGHQ